MCAKLHCGTLSSSKQSVGLWSLMLYLLLLQFVIVSLTGWGLLFTAGYKFFTGGKKSREGVFISILKLVFLNFQTH